MENCLLKVAESFIIAGRYDECVLRVENECLNFRGLQDNANFRTKNWALATINPVRGNYDET